MTPDQSPEPRKQQLWQPTHSKGLTKLAILLDYRRFQMFCRALQLRQRLSIILVNKVVLKLKISKNCFNKKCAPRLTFLLNPILALFDRVAKTTI